MQRIKYTKKFNIPYLVIDKYKEKFEKYALKELRDKKIKLLCLAGLWKFYQKNLSEISIVI